MKFTLDSIAQGSNVIRAYGPGRINVSDRIYTRSLVLAPDRLLDDWPAERFEDITLENLQSALEMQPEILVIGTGAVLRFPAARILAEIQARGIGLEVLDTAAACRTYNVLVSENRKVTAALLVIPARP